MNLFDLGGQLLRVGRAVTPPGDRNLGAGGVPQAMPRFDASHYNQFKPTSCNQLLFLLQCICSSSSSSNSKDPGDGRSGDQLGSGRFKTCLAPRQTCSAGPKPHNCCQPHCRLEGQAGQLQNLVFLRVLSDGCICLQIRKCGLPRDELGRPIKIMPGQGVQMGPKRPPGDRTPRY